MELKKVIISGATGMIGLALIRQFLKRNIPVTVIANPDSKRLSRIPQSPLVQIVKCRLSELDSLTERLEPDYSAFLDLAWAGTTGQERNDIFLQSQNIEFAADAVRLAKNLNCHTFVGTGSQAEYGLHSQILRVDTPCFPVTGYGIAKLAAGQLTRLYCAQNQMRCFWFRILSAYGPYDQPNSVVMSSLKKMRKNEKAEYTPGEQFWNFIYCDDVAEIMIRAIEGDQPGDVYPLGSDETRKLKDSIEMMKAVSQSGSELEFGAVPYGPMQIMHLEADVEPLKKDFGYTRFTGFEEGIKKTVEWMEEQEEGRENEQK